MRRAALLTFTAMALCLAATQPAGAEPRGHVPEFVLDGAWYVELAAPPIADGGSEATIRGQQDAFRSAARAARLRYAERRSFRTLWNGVSVDVEPRDVSKLGRLPGVKAFYPVGRAVPDPLERAESDLATAAAMTGVDIAQSRLGYTGAGVKVGIIDSGIDYHHPDLGGCFGAGCRVVTGWDFVGDDAAAPTPDGDPDDCFGHGTHVAGIVGADGRVKGVAPGVSFGAYRIFGCTDNSVPDDIAIAALERALADGMDVVNMSFGASRLGTWPNHPWAQAVDRLVNKGVVVVASAGNAADLGVYASSSPSNAKNAIAAASFLNTHQELRVFRAGPDGRRMGYATYLDIQGPPTTGAAELADAGDACSPLEPGSLTGKYVLVHGGDCLRIERARNIHAAGAIGGLLYVDAPNVAASGGWSAVPPVPFAVISRADGEELAARLEAGVVSLSWTDETMTVPVVGGGLISWFSSFGPAPDLSLKPDIGSPGGLIHSTTTLESGGYMTASGTSMAAPHVAGATALLLDAKPRTPAHAVRDVLQNSADPRPWWGNPALGALDNVHRQGAGMLDIDDAILATARVTPAKLSLGESESGPATRTLTIANDADRPVTYRLSHAAALSTGGSVFFPSFLGGFAQVQYAVAGVAADIVTVPARGSANVDATITASPRLLDRSVYGGYLVLADERTGATYRVPYVGFKGDYQSIDALPEAPEGAPPEESQPWLAKFGGGTFPRQPDGVGYTMQGDDIPWIVSHLAHHARRLDVKLQAADGRGPAQLASRWDYTKRNHFLEFFVTPIDGWVKKGDGGVPVPNGRYRAVVTVTKALGDPDVANHTQTWTSPVFRIARP